LPARGRGTAPVLSATSDGSGRCVRAAGGEGRCVRAAGGEGRCVRAAGGEGRVTRWFTVPKPTGNRLLVGT
ncbi:hypothetical protein B7486_79160, partial [cyanobacterium TDX16]